jgi:YbbR domain-containing protein
LRRSLQDIGIKVASLLLALVVWFIVAGEKTSEIGLTVPVELQNLPKDLEVVGDAVNSVEVRLRATPAIIRRLSPGDVQFQIDLQGLEEGEHYLHLTEGSVRRPFGVTVVKLTPASIRLVLERTLVREVPIRARVRGTPAPGFEIAEVVTDPETVELAGPRSRVRATPDVFTEAVDVDGAKQTVTAEVNIGIGDPLLRLVGSPRVTVTAKIRERHGERTLTGMRVGVRGGDGGRVRPAHVDVVLRGPESLLNELPASAVEAYVNVAPSQPRALLPVAIQLAPGLSGLTVSRVEPPEVRFVAGSGH